MQVIALLPLRHSSHPSPHSFRFLDPNGYLLRLVYPHNWPTLYVRQPGSDAEEVLAFHGDDPFFGEMSTFVDLAKTGKAEVPVLSSYADGACRLSR